MPDTAFQWDSDAGLWLSSLVTSNSHVSCSQYVSRWGVDWTALYKLMLGLPKKKKKIPYIAEMVLEGKMKLYWACGLSSSRLCLVCWEGSLLSAASSLLSQGSTTFEQMGWARLSSWLIHLCALGPEEQIHQGRTSCSLFFEALVMARSLPVACFPEEWEASVIDAPGVEAPPHPFRKQEGQRDSAQVFFHSLRSLTLITFCCGKEMRWGLKNRSLSAS